MPLLTDAVLAEIATRCDTVFIHGEESLLCDPALVAYIREKLMPLGVPVIGVPGAAHHGEQSTTRSAQSSD